MSKGTVVIMITIFTPTYNRKKELENLYESLKKQDFEDFEWVIVDDGSIDNTQEYIKKIYEEHIINIRYYKQENQGKSMAYNKGIEMAKGDLFICIDDDDALMPNVLNEINNEYLKIKDNQDIAGIGFLNCYKENEEIVGSKFPKNNMIETYYDIYNKFGITGDKNLMFKTNILKNYLFPKFDNEKFVPEALIFNRISKKYKMLFVNKKIIYVNYLSGGYSSNYFNLAKTNPQRKHVIL